MNKPIYLDNHATTPMDPRVLEEMLPFLKEEFGNPSSSTHCLGWQAKASVEKARSQVAHLVGCRPDEIVFTSGATESNNWALVGSLKPGDHVVSTQLEHPSVLSVLERLESQGVKVTLVSPNRDGMIDVDAVVREIGPSTKLVSVMYANNEIGTILPVVEVAKRVKEKGVLFHCDAVQAAGRIAIDVADFPVDFLSLSAHKVYGPKGIGALFVRRAAKDLLMPFMVGGGQEKGLRAGTLNVPGIVGFGFACELATREAKEDHQRIFSLRNRLWAHLKETIPRIKLNGPTEERLAGNLNFCIEGIDGEGLLLFVQNQIAISASSACCSAGSRGSRVLAALGMSFEDIQSSFRIGIGRFNTVEDIDAAAKVLCLAQAGARC